MGFHRKQGVAGCNKLSMINLLFRVTLIALFFGNFNFGPPNPPARPMQEIQFNSRLERYSEYGGPVRAVVLDGVDALLAEGETIVRVPLIGPAAFQPTERHTLQQGPILDLILTPQALYALTSQSIVILSPDARQIQNILPGGGERLTILNETLMVTARQAGAHLYLIQPTGDLIAQDWIGTPTENRQSALIDSRTIAMADRSAGVRLLELKDEKAAQFISAIPNTAPPDGLAVFDHWLFSTSAHHLNVIDAFNPQNPGIIGRYAPVHDIQNIIWRDNLALIADGTDGLKVYDVAIANAAAGPRYLNSQADTPSFAVGLDSTNQYLLSGEPTGLRVYDATRLPDLVPLGFAPLWSAPTAIMAVPNSTRILVSVGAGGLAIVDITAPFSPSVMEALPFAGPVEYALAHPNDPTLLYVTLGDGRLVTLRFNPNAAEKVIVTSDLPLSGQPGEMMLDASQEVLAVASGRAGLDFYALGADHSQPVRITTLTSQSLNKGGVKSVKLTDSGKWLVLDGDQLRIIRLLGKRQFVEDGKLTVDGTTLAVHGTTALVGGSNQMTLVDVQQDAPRQISNYQAPSRYADLTAQLTQVILASDNGDLIILDVTNRTRPREQRFIPTAFPIERLLIRGDDWLLVNAKHGLTHLRFSLLLANEPSVLPTLAGTYTSIQDTRQILPFEDGSIGLAGESWFKMRSTGEVMASAPTARSRSAAILGTDVFLLYQHLTRLDANGQIVAENPNLPGAAIASDGSFLWLIGYRGQLQAIDPATLQPATPIRQASLGIEVTSLTAADGLLYIGTQTGEVVIVAPPAENVTTPEILIRSRIPDMGGPVVDIYPVAGQPGQVVASASEGGVWWLNASDPRNTEIIAHSPLLGRSIAATTSADANWLAVATGACGIQILDASQRDLGLRPMAEWYGGSVSDVHFVGSGSGTLMALVGGVPTMYRFNPEAPPMPPPAPHRPVPPNATDLTMPVQTLTWLPAPDPCQRLEYEVWVDGQLMGKTRESRWLLPAPLESDIRWQIISIDAQGNRTPGAVWRVYTSLEGWANAPEMFEVGVMDDDDEKSTLPKPFSWAMLGLIFAGLSLVVLGGMIWRAVRR